MISVSNFPGDDDNRLFDIQFEVYDQVIGIIVNTARDRFLAGELVLRYVAQMSMQVRQLTSFDHRTIQDIHDLIAAWYRFRKRTERLFPLEGDARQDWIEFASLEARALCSSADFITGVLDACVYANTEAGYAGEQRAKRVQEERYNEMIRHNLSGPQAG